MQSLTEQVSVRTGPLKANRVAVHAVSQYPIRFDMKVAARLMQMVNTLDAYHAEAPSNRD